ncbi:UNVERIFIED_CONTAM: hypothetical protein FKN15_008805 [Acipenser sinensis]
MSDRVRHQTGKRLETCVLHLRKGKIVMSDLVRHRTAKGPMYCVRSLPDIDIIQCDRSSPVEIEAYSHVQIKCFSSASESPEYTWIQNNYTVSNSSTLDIAKMTKEKSGIYTVIAGIPGISLQSQAEIVVTLKKGDVKNAENGRLTGLVMLPIVLVFVIIIIFMIRRSIEQKRASTRASTTDSVRYQSRYQVPCSALRSVAVTLFGMEPVPVTRFQYHSRDQ